MTKNGFLVCFCQTPVHFNPYIIFFQIYLDPLLLEPFNKAVQYHNLYNAYCVCLLSNMNMNDCLNEHDDCLKLTKFY